MHFGFIILQNRKQFICSKTKNQMNLSFHVQFSSLFLFLHSSKLHDQNLCLSMFSIHCFKYVYQSLIITSFSILKRLDDTYLFLIAYLYFNQQRLTELVSNGSETFSKSRLRYSVNEVDPVSTKFNKGTIFFFEKTCQICKQFAIQESLLCNNFPISNLIKYCAETFDILIKVPLFLLFKLEIPSVAISLNVVLIEVKS